MVYPFDEAGDLLWFHREFTAAAPDPLCCYASVRTAPAVEFIPEAFHGERIATTYLCYSGALEDADEVIGPLRSYGEPIVDAIEPRPYTELQQLFDGVYPPGFRNHWTSRFVSHAGLTDDAIDTILHFARTITSPYSSIVVEHLGGIIGRIAPQTTAFAHRDAGDAFHIFTRWQSANEDEGHIDWTTVFFDSIAPSVDEGAYVNFLGDEDADSVSTAFGDNIDRLVDVKRRYDPENLFRVNHNIDPNT